MCAPVFFGQKAQFAGAHGHELVHASAPTKFTKLQANINGRKVVIRFRKLYKYYEILFFKSL